MATTEQAIKVGSFCWADLMSKDKTKTKEFYEKALGWSFQDIPMGEGAAYTMVMVGEKAIGGMNQMDDNQMKMGLPSHWVSYVLVDEVAATVEKAKGLGAKVMMGPMEAGEFGTMAVLQDPTGAVFALWKSKQGESPKVDGLGTICWNELLTKDTSGAAGFYTALFGWKAESMDMNQMEYTVFKNGEEMAGGMMVLPKEAQEHGAPPHWLHYISVDDCDQTANKIKELGGNICMPPTDFPGVGRGSVVTDPTGGAFGIIKLLDKEGC